MCNCSRDNLEIVQDLSTEAFLHALRRFAAHHGWPQLQTIISDKGTSFVGAEAVLEKLLTKGRKNLEDFAIRHKLKWKFNTPASPHQGGFFESMVKLTKSTLKVIVGQQTLSWNDMATVFAEVECLVNSSPLGYPSGVVRNVRLQTKSGTYKRSVQKCCLLLEEESS